MQITFWEPDYRGKAYAGRRLFAFLAAGFLGLAMLFPAVAAPGGSHGDLPLPALPPSKTRDAILRSAQRLMGTPYVFGGESAKGIDCSGLVYLVFKEATGRTVPRTVDTLGPWVLLIPRQELKAGDLVFFNLNSASSTASRGSSPSKATFAAADHVGIYAGDNEFYHAASAGSRTGVIKNSLSEASWSRRFLFAGRAVPASALSGLSFEVGLLGILDAGMISGQTDQGQTLRGAGLSLSTHYPVGNNFSLGLRTRLEYDDLLSDFRIPLELVIGQNTGFSLFAGPALTLGEPGLAADTSSPARAYEAPASWISTAGLRWSAAPVNYGASGFGLFLELRFNRYLPVTGEPENLEADRRAAISLSLGFRYKTVHY